MLGSPFHYQVPGKFPSTIGIAAKLGHYTVMVVPTCDILYDFKQEKSDTLVQKKDENGQAGPGQEFAEFANLLVEFGKEIEEVKIRGIALFK